MKSFRHFNMLCSIHRVETVEQCAVSQECRTARIPSMTFADRTIAQATPPARLDELKQLAHRLKRAVDRSYYRVPPST